MNDHIYHKLNALADQAGCTRIRERYNEVRLSMQRRITKQYAVLGDVNVGKSTIINILAGEKKLPVSLRSNEHGKVAFVESLEHNCKWVELNSTTYVGDSIADADSPLWHMDAAIYILSATTPFSQQDLEAVKACIAHGVPCTLALSKLDVVDAGEREEIIAYIKTQSERHFGSDALVILNVRDAEATKQTVLNEFQSAEDSRDIRDYMLAVSYAKALKEHIAAQYDEAKEQMQQSADRQKQTRQSQLDEKIAWDRILLEIDRRKAKLIEAMSVEMNHLYSDCIASLSNRAMSATSAKEWWEKSLEREFRKELITVSNSIDRLICSRIAQDRDWLVRAVEQQFGTKLNVDNGNTRTRLESVAFGMAPQQLSANGKAKTMAMTGLIVSSVALCVLSYPVLVMHSANLTYWKLAGAAVAGTGFWTFMATKKEKDEKLQCLKAEVSRYILASRDENIDVLKKNIAYGYNSLKISVQDLQLANAKVPVSEADGEAQVRFRTMSEINRKCDEIISSLLSDEE